MANRVFGIGVTPYSGTGNDISHLDTTAQTTQGVVDWVKQWDDSGSNGAQSVVDSILGNTGSNTFLGGLGNIFNKVVSAWDDYVGNTANRENIAFQKEYNEQVFKRADTQFQRTVADLRAAGLSSQLAAGAPSTVAGVSKAPERTVGNESAAIGNLISMITAMKQTQSNSLLASAQADKATAEAELYRAEAGSYGERLSVDLALKRSQGEYYTQYSSLLQKEGQFKTELIQSEIQRNLSTSAYQNNLADLALKEIEKADVDMEEVRKRTSLLGYQISSEVAKKRNLDASTEYIVRETTNASLDYVITNAVYEYNKTRGDSPNATQVSSSQSEEKKKDRIHDYIMKGITSLTSVGLGVGGFMFGASRGINKKMFGDDHIDPWTIVR